MQKSAGAEASDLAAHAPGLDHVWYTVDFVVAGASGKEKATREKARVLRSHAGEFSFKAPAGRFSRMLRPLERVLFQLSIALQLITAKRPPTVVISRGLVSVGAFLGARARGLFLVREVHADAMEEVRLLYPSATPRRFASSIAARLNLWLDRNADFRIFNHPRLAVHYAAHLRAGEPCTWAYNGADTTTFAPGDRKRARQKLGLPEDRTLLVFVGSMAPWHGVQRAVRLFEAAERQGLDATMVLAGGGPGRASPEVPTSSSNIQVWGRIPGEKALALIQAADFCVLPCADIRVSPGSPLKLYDYLACGKSVITERSLPGYSDVVEETGSGWTLDLDSPEEAATELLDIVAQGPLPEERVRSAATAHASWETTITRWVAGIHAALTADETSRKR